MPDRAYFHPIDPELVPGARNAIDVCLRLKREERITIVTDTVTRDIAAALQREVERVGSEAWFRHVRIRDICRTG
jgi:leucyl aminopeptidase (aminopeptidase T)